jgi:predicted nucleic acid-binding protein
MIDLVYSDEILLEYVYVLGRRELKLRRDDIDLLIEEIQARGISVATVPWPVTVPDPSDSTFLAAALTGQAMLVTGNMRHYPPSVRLGVEVMSPRTFVDQYVAGIMPSERRSKREP